MRYRNREFDYLMQKYEYASKDSLVGAFRKLYGICLGRRIYSCYDTEISSNVPYKDKHRNQFIKETSNPTILSLKTEKRHSTMGVFQDAHIPFHDPRVIALIRSFFVELQPDYITIPGDWWDLYQLSRFNRDPDRINKLQSDIDKGVSILRLMRLECPNTKFIFEDGNHEDRLRKFIWRSTQEMVSLRCFNPDELLGLIELEIDRVPKQCILEVNGIFKVEHGDVASKHSSWTAKAMFERRGGCGMCGHSHRGGVYYKSDIKDWGWWENYCTCNLHPEYVKNPNWMHGFSLIHFVGDRFWVEMIPIINYKFIYGGKIFE